MLFVGIGVGALHPNLKLPEIIYIELSQSQVKAILGVSSSLTK
jgi:hypothetical protein